MADLTFKDWGRIYAYVWLQDRLGNPYYKDSLETDPVRAITEIIEALNKDYPDPNLKIKYIPNVDAVWDIEPLSELKDKMGKLEEYRVEEYRNGKKRATLHMRLTC